MRMRHRDPWSIRALPFVADAGNTAVSPGGPLDHVACFAEIARWRERAEAAEARLAELENAVTWNTSCTSCARTLDGSVAEHERAERAEAKLAGVSAFWLVTDEDGDIILNAPCADTLGCLWSSCPGGERVTLGQLIAAAGTHTGMAAGEMHAGLAVATGETGEGPPNNGNPVIHSGAVAPGGWVCAVPVPASPDQICGMPVESEPCTEHGESSTDERGI